MNKLNDKLFSTMITTCIIMQVMLLIMNIGNYTAATTFKLFIIWCIPTIVCFISIIWLLYRIKKVWK
ncbi:MAG: hypothetical protein [Cryophage ML09]|nr:MAG: hypothetical protein [Cryophage ML09]